MLEVIVIPFAYFELFSGLSKESEMTEWFAIITITILAVISPGPDFAMVSRNALTLSKRAGLLTALGIGVGVLVHVSYTLMGIGVLIRYAPWALDLMKIGGALYLIWLGTKMLRSQPRKNAMAEQNTSRSDRAAFRVGLWTNALNPKTSIFIVSLFTQVVGIETPLLTRIGYGGFISVVHVLWFASVALFFGAPLIRQTLFQVSHWIDRAFGVVLIVFGASLAFADLSYG